MKFFYAPLALLLAVCIVLSSCGTTPSPTGEDWSYSSNQPLSLLLVNDSRVLAERSCATGKPNPVWIESGKATSTKGFCTKPQAVAMEANASYWYDTVNNALVIIKGSKEHSIPMQGRRIDQLLTFNQSLFVLTAVGDNGYNQPAILRYDLDGNPKDKALLLQSGKRPFMLVQSDQLIAVQAHGNQTMVAVLTNNQFTPSDLPGTDPLPVGTDSLLVQDHNGCTSDTTKKVSLFTPGMNDQEYSFNTCLQLYNAGIWSGGLGVVAEHKGQVSLMVFSPDSTAPKRTIALLSTAPIPLAKCSDLAVFHSDVKGNAVLNVVDADAKVHSWSWPGIAGDMLGNGKTCFMSITGKASRVLALTP